MKLKGSVKKGKQEPRDHHQTRHSPNSLALFATDSLELKLAYTAIKEHTNTHKRLIFTTYQSPLLLTELFQHNLINVSYLMACYLYQVMMTLHFFNDVANDAESTQNQKLRHNHSFEEWSTMGKLINRIPGSRLLVSSLPGSALRTHVESLGKPRDVNKRSQILAW